jgi:hypothetical protein
MQIGTCQIISAKKVPLYVELFRFISLGGFIFFISIFPKTSVFGTCPCSMPFYAEKPCIYGAKNITKNKASILCSYNVFGTV